MMSFNRTPRGRSRGGLTGEGRSVKCAECDQEPQGGAVRVGKDFYCLSVVRCLIASYEAEKATGEERVFVAKKGGKWPDGA